MGRHNKKKLWAPHTEFPFFLKEMQSVHISNTSNIHFNEIWRPLWGEKKAKKEKNKTQQQKALRRRWIGAPPNFYLSTLLFYDLKMAVTNDVDVYGPNMCMSQFHVFLWRRNWHVAKAPLLKKHVKMRLRYVKVDYR